MRIGRNDLCPCGSEKKYKKCCLTSALTAGEAPHPENWPAETELEILDRAVPAKVIGSVMEEVDTWSPAEFQKHTKDAATQYPALIAFVVAMLMKLNPQSRNQSLLVVITLIRIFERHYGRGHNEILENDIKAVVERNARLMVNTVDGLDQNPGDVVQPFLLQFIADVAFDFEHDEMPKTEDGHTMLLVLKSTLDILDRAYAGTRVATELVLTTPA